MIDHKTAIAMAKECGLVRIGEGWSEPARWGMTEILALVDAAYAAGAKSQLAESPAAWRMRNTSFRGKHYEYHTDKVSAETRQADFNRSVDEVACTI
jgi:hypothetical protein